MITGLNNKNILAPFTFEGHCNTKLFEEYIEQKLSPYSPDLNPIEHYWHKIKNEIIKKMRNNEMKLAKAMNSMLTRMSTC
jgi:transposase